MMHAQTPPGPDGLALDEAVNRALRAIPPLWPLASSVAVNPFLGQTDQDLATVSARLERVAGVAATMPRSWYLAQITGGHITQADLSAALASAPPELRPASLAELTSRAQAPRATAEALPSIASLAAQISGIDWPGLIAERFGAWAAGYFDQGQALWAAPRGRGAYAAWRSVATHDLTPEIAGLAGFATYVSEAPETASSAISRMVQRIAMPEASLETYFHQMLMTLGGWAQYARYLLWQAELGGADDPTLRDFLAIRLLWEEALFDRYGQPLADRWQEVMAAHARPVTPTADHILDAILQDAADRATQRGLAETLSRPGRPTPNSRPALQAAFCIDVRSEVFRWALESVHPEIQTLGFAGFFGVAASHRSFASDVPEHRLPVLLNPALTTRSGGPDDAAADQAARFKARAKRAWGRFKLAAVSSFAFVEATGPVYATKLVCDALGHGTRTAAHAASPNDPAPRPDPSLDLATKARAAETVLRAMSLTANFAPLVLLAGHGAHVVNNPHASALHCGACGGYAGDVNARLLAALLNDPEVRAALAPRGIDIPADTLFIPALHDTTTDSVTLYTQDHPAARTRPEIRQVTSWLEAAGVIARGERALRLPRATSGASLFRRSRDWAETRPEWALAGCKAFIAAPRPRTAGKSLEGRAFLHDYDWTIDRDFEVLELILTAPVVVASWISLQYYGSTVAPGVFGGGNKLLHNVTGGIGVVEGNGGVLRGGLPWQSVHDGERFVHEPIRLSVCIEAPRDAITTILQRHTAVRALFDNRWLHLFALDDAGRIAWRYAGELQWTAMIATPDP